MNHFLPFCTMLSIIASSIFALLLYHQPRLQKITTFGCAGLSGTFATYLGLTTLFNSQTISYHFTTTFPQLTLQLVLDPLAGFFLVIIGIIVIGIAFYGPEYLNEHQSNSLTPIYFFTGIFIASMYLILLAHDAFTFMLAWELMSISSYFLVISNHENPTNRHAALIYLLMAQTSGLLILFAYSILVKTTNSFSFAIWHNTQFSPYTANLAFLLAFLGFGMKAGIVPLHIWLPKAHPVAPSHISALMSGVMLKMAVYGFIRFTFELLQNITWQWGILTLFIGTVSAIFGVMYALMQHDLKKLLAYHSVENIGIIYCALGLSIIFTGTKHPLLATLGLIAALYHSLNHALFKSLLFLGAGIISKFTHEYDLEKMGGLIKKMPYTAWCFLIGCISISALPPFNGFVSEWLFLQTALQATVLKSEIMRTIIPITAALIALTSALAAACFVKVYGVAFLGQSRTGKMQHSHDPHVGMKIALSILAGLCLFFGIVPNITIKALNTVTWQLLHTTIPHTQNWLWLIPLDPQTSGYNPFLIIVGFIIILSLAIILLRIFYPRTKTKITKPWECGFGNINEKMQYSATAFAMPIRRIFNSLYLAQEKIEKHDNHINYSLQIHDHILQYIYLPLGKLSTLIARNFARLQGGKVRVYLTYIFITLILLLWITM